MLTGTPEDQISAYVADNDIDMLVMGAYGHSRIRYLVIGSTTTEMIRICRIPVLLFR
jgi:nucleotide-binding universal stress UspA family protein